MTVHLRAWSHPHAVSFCDGERDVQTTTDANNVTCIKCEAKWDAKVMFDKYEKLRRERGLA